MRREIHELDPVRYQATLRLRDHLLLWEILFSISYQFGTMKYQIRKTEKQISNTDVKSVP